MSDSQTTNRRTLLAAFGSTALLGALSQTASAEEPKSDTYGFVVVETDPKNEEMGLKEKPKEPEKTDDIKVLKYERIGGPIVFHGQVWVNTKDLAQTITFGEVAKGPPPFHGLFEGYYVLNSANLSAFFYDNPTKPQEGLHVKLELGKSVSYVLYRTGYKRLLLPGWAWGPWHVLKAW